MVSCVLRVECGSNQKKSAVHPEGISSGKLGVQESGSSGEFGHSISSGSKILPHPHNFFMVYGIKKSNNMEK